MSRRTRLEDLGRLSEKLDKILDSTIFERLDDKELFEGLLRSTERGIILRDELTDLRSDLSDAWHLARFGDDEDLYEDIYGKDMPDEYEGLPEDMEA